MVTLCFVRHPCPTAPMLCRSLRPLGCVWVTAAPSRPPPTVGPRLQTAVLPAFPHPVLHITHHRQAPLS
eukprot:228084-Chlamydomonas_euryale.AAC.1